MAIFFRSDGWVKSALGPAVAGAQIYVCNQPTDTTYVPPTALASIYADPAGNVPIVQPIITDGFGHYDFYASSGVYTIVVVNGGKTQQVYPDQSIGGVGTSGGTSVVFETNGTTNPNQLLQNLVQGYGIILSTDNSGNTTINSPDPDDYIQIISSDGPITLSEGTVLITKTSQAHLTLNPPTAGAQPVGDDGSSLRIVAVTPYAHVITTNTVPYNNGTKYVLTLVPPSSGLLVAYGGAWYLVLNNAGTLS